MQKLMNSSCNLIIYHLKLQQVQLLKNNKMLNKNNMINMINILSILNNPINNQVITINGMK
jgi:hypothetical protein